MKQLADEGMTMVVVTHEMSFARRVANRVVVFERGAIVEEGPPQQIFDAPTPGADARFPRTSGLARMTQRLSNATLRKIAPGVVTPRYDRAKLAPRIVHLGIGAFFRAHGAMYTEDVLHARGGDWGIVGVSLQRPDQRDRMAPQDGLFTTLQRDGSGTSARVVGSVLSVLVALENPPAVVAFTGSPRHGNRFADGDRERLLP